MPDLPIRDYDGSAEVLYAIAHPARLKILCAIKDEAFPVNEIASMTGSGPPTLSQQLAVLRNADLVTTRRQGKRIFYRVNRARMLAASELLDALAGTAGAVPNSADQSSSTRGGAAKFARILAREAP